jgi:hypothetical protein
MEQTVYEKLRDALIALEVPVEEAERVARAMVEVAARKAVRRWANGRDGKAR